jgi:hypothetical protein
VTTLFNFDTPTVQPPMLFLRNLLQPLRQDICLFQNFLAWGGSGGAHEAGYSMHALIRSELDGLVHSHQCSRRFAWVWRLPQKSSARYRYLAQSRTYDTVLRLPPCHNCATRYLRHSGHCGRKLFLIQLIGKSHADLDQMAWVPCHDFGACAEIFCTK